jgi:glycosyltransferase involved in cell wall biosynthesis
VKLLFVTHGFPRGPQDFAGRFLLDLAQGQRARGHAVRVVAPHDAGLPLAETMDGVEIRRFRYGRDAQETLAYRGTMADAVLRSWAARWRLVALLGAMRRAVRQAVREWQPDVVHVHWWFPGGLALWPGHVGAPAVITSHGTDLFLLDRAAPLRWLARRVFARSRAVTVISAPLRARVEALGVPAQRIAVAPMPTAEAAALPRRPVPGRLLFLGRLTERKGAQVAVAALHELVAGGSDVHLRIVGDGPERAALEAQVRSLGLEARVTFAGAVPPQAVPREYAEAELFLMPALTDWKGEQEGFGLVLIEAIRAGLPVVASASGGIADIVRDGETGLLVPERDSAALAAAVRRLRADPVLAARLAAAAQADVAARFSAASIAAAYESVYRDALRNDR